MERLQTNRHRGCVRVQSFEVLVKALVPLPDKWHGLTDIDLEALQVSLPDGTKVAFPVEAFARHCLLQGIDELTFLRSKLPQIERYEQCRP